MRYFIFLFIFFALSVNKLLAQESVGFSNPENIDPILDYRLPDWQYSNFYLDFDASSSGSYLKYDMDEQRSKRGNVGLIPSYNYYKESEDRIVQFNSSVGVGYSTRKQVTNSSISNSTENELRVNSLDAVINLNASIREYLSGEIFLYGNGNLMYDHYGNKNEEKTDGTLDAKVVRYERQFSVRPQLGIGFGRIRNITPVIRAVRLQERLGALGGNVNFTGDDVLAAADQFAKYNGYQRTYDRPEKNFWSDMDDATSASLGTLSAFDMLYLTDVFDEAVGSRFEGWEVTAGAEFDYKNNLVREERPLMTDPVSRNHNISKTLGAFMSGRWYKNTSLDQQWGIVADLGLSYPLNDAGQGFSELKRRTELSAEVNWLWTITDRILLETSLQELYTRNKISRTGFTGGQADEFSEWRNFLSLNVAVNYFIENQMQLNFSAGPNLQHRGDTENNDALGSRIFNWQANVGLRYYFSRKLY